MWLACLLALPLAAAPVQAPTPSQALAALLKSEWEWLLKEHPDLGLQAGRYEHVAEVEQLDPKTLAARRAHDEATDKALRAIPISALAADEAATHAVLWQQVRSSIEEYDQGAYLMPINGDSGFHTDAAMWPRNFPFATEAHYRMYLARLAKLPRFFDENLALMDAGVRRGLTVSQVVLKGRDQAAREHAEAKGEKSVFYVPFLKMPAVIPEGIQAALRAHALEVIASSVVPAYKKVADYLKNTYLPSARKTLGASQLPDGENYYRGRIRQYVTKDVSPSELHELGRSEVARIRGRMEALLKEEKFKGDLAAYFQYLRTDRKFYATTPEGLLSYAALLAKNIDGALPRFFGKLPRQPFVIEPVPDAIAPFYSAGRYVPGNDAAMRAGAYWVNTHDLKSRPLYALPALTLHEAVPGHHMQIATAAEQTQMHPLRRFAYFSVTGEGWALYAEKLGEEMGIYRNGPEQMGRLTYDMWRACRLVVDTGIHTKGWTREQAQAFMRDNTALSLHEIETEVDRYISWPGQALAYKYGERALIQLRDKAAAALREQFDLRKFHDLILSLGSVPLSVWEREVDRLIASAGK